MTDPFYRIGTVTDSVAVRLSYRIIQLFSEGLYSSPNKAVEELVVNSFDAGARNVHILISPDLSLREGSIAVIDDGTGMNVAGLQQHWIVGASTKRDEDYSHPSGRRPIGKFGIGKLASYVLANRLTHITKADGRYFSTSMNYSCIPDQPLGYVQYPSEASDNSESESVSLDVLELSSEEAREALQPWTSSSLNQNISPDIFSDDGPDSWTVAIMTDLKRMASDIRLGRLRYILSTAMPLRDDFHLYLNGQEIQSHRIDRERLGRWTLGRDLIDIPQPAPNDLEVRMDQTADESNSRRYGIANSEIGRVWGYVEIFENPIDTGKSVNLVGRNNGFFVYARERLLNIDDAGFGIDRNLLRHGTFSRLRVVVHVDRLDRELRSSRESMREGEVLTQVRHLLHGLFNFARSKLAESQESSDPRLRLARRLASSPASLVERPIILGVQAAMARDLSLRTVDYPRGLTASGQEEFIELLRDRTESEEGLIVAAVLKDLSHDRSIALLDVETGVLSINTLHPFVASFVDDFVDIKRNLPLELLSASEVLLEMKLYEHDLAPEIIENIMLERDDLLREVARTSGRTNALTTANNILDSVNDRKALEEAVVAAFESLGFHAIAKGGKNEPDGIADAPLSARDGDLQRYRVSLEAKSKESSGTRVRNDAVKVSTLARHRNDHQCDWSVVVGPDFSTSLGENSAVLREIEEDFQNHDGKRGITLVRAEDLARLVRHAPAKRVSLSELRQLFETCRSPDAASEWIDDIIERVPVSHQYKEVLDTIWSEQQADEAEPVTYGALRAALRHAHQLKFSDSDLQELCKAFMQMAAGHVYATDRSVELTMRPDIVLSTIAGYVSEIQR